MMRQHRYAASRAMNEEEHVKDTLKALVITEETHFLEAQKNVEALLEVQKTQDEANFEGALVCYKACKAFCQISFEGKFKKHFDLTAFHCIL